MNILLLIGQLLSMLANNALVQKIVQCLLTNTSWAAIMTCVAAQKTGDPHEDAMIDLIVATLDKHAKANP